MAGQDYIRIAHIAFVDFDIAVPCSFAEVDISALCSSADFDIAVLCSFVEAESVEAESVEAEVADNLSDYSLFDFRNLYIL
ncbi:MAG: hypothetical protein IJ167_07225 [Lachnospiraceae bacterium]|nr:hypothetical protein [Lachnospiraceae bacterium]